MNKKQKLELTWIGKESRPKLEPRILLEDPAKGYYAKHRVADNDIFDSWLIFGDNLLAQALCKQEGATYVHGDVHCWMPGHSTERDFICVCGTTTNLNHEQLQGLNN